MISKKLVSIIVPVYNADGYLSDCIDSILKQTYANIELILVDDGSTDGSADVCDVYATRDSRVRVFHQVNAGPSAARNKGMAAAKGEYIQFADSDDYIEPFATERLVKAIGTDNQLVICGYYKILTKDHQIIDSKLFHIEQAGSYTKEEFLGIFGDLYQYLYVHFTWNKLYVAELIKSSNLAFDPAVSWGEDLLFNLKYIEKCQRIQLIEDALYYYVDSNEASITSGFRPDLFRNMQMMQGTTRAFLQRNQAYYGRNKDQFEQFYASRVVICLWNLFNPKSTLSRKQTRQHISDIVNDERVNQSLAYFRTGNIDRRITGILIRKKAVSLIYLYFSFRSYLKRKMEPKEKKWI